MNEDLEFIEPGSPRQGFNDYHRARIVAGEKFPEVGASVYQAGWLQALSSARERLVKGAGFDEETVTAILAGLVNLDAS